jgi:hypothetical protein
MDRREAHTTLCAAKRRGEKIFASHLRLLFALAERPRILGYDRLAAILGTESATPFVVLATRMAQLRKAVEPAGYAILNWREQQGYSLVKKSVTLEIDKDEIRELRAA